MRTLSIFLVVFLLSVVSAKSQVPFIPSLHSVSGVAVDDVLNIRSEPNPSAEVVGALEHSATEIEVVSVNEDGSWGKIGIGEIGGWVSMRFLNAEPLPDDLFEKNLTCFGTEPFWALRLNGDTAEYALHEDRADGLALSGVQPRNTMKNFAYAFDLTGPDRSFSGFVIIDACSDGMADRVYGFRSMLLERSADGMSAVIGCCSLQEF